MYMEGIINLIVVVTTILASMIGQQFTTGLVLGGPADGCPDRCGRVLVPFPFGVGSEECYLHPGFRMVCNTTYRHPKLFQGNIEVAAISIESHQMTIKQDLSYWCYTKKSSQLTHGLDLTNTPFRLSMDNLFTVVGCDTSAVIGGTIGCISMCQDRSNIVDGSCSGYGCCQTSIQQGLSKYNISFNNVNNHSDILSFNPCSFAFLVAKANYTFKTSDLFTLRKKSSFPVVLDWDVGNETCEEAQMNKTTYACVSKNSVCVNSANEHGYYCNCSKGYHGNPYLLNGCQDIDECKDLKTYPCNGICTNSVGGYECVCPEGTTGDPLKNGCSGIPNIASSSKKKTWIIIQVVVVTLPLALAFITICIRALTTLRRTLIAAPSRSGIKIFTREEIERAIGDGDHRHGIPHYGGFNSPPRPYACPPPPRPYACPPPPRPYECPPPPRPYECPPPPLQAARIFHPYGSLDEFGSFYSPSHPVGSNSPAQDIYEESCLHESSPPHPVGSNSQAEDIYEGLLSTTCLHESSPPHPYGFNSPAQDIYEGFSSRTCLHESSSPRPYGYSPPEIIPQAGAFHQTCSSVQKRNVLKFPDNIYKGTLPDTTTVAIEKLHKTDENEVKDFVDKITVLSQVDHRNVVKVLGYCVETPMSISLVYEYVPNGTLSYHIQKSRTDWEIRLEAATENSFLNWKVRLKIAAETASALCCLHSLSPTSVIHRDLKSCNVFLDLHYTAKLAGFDTAVLVPADNKIFATTIIGTLGYVDPEYLQTQRLTEKSDVYSFGVILVELLTGLEPYSSSLVGEEQERSLAKRFASCMKANMLDQILDSTVYVEESAMSQIKKVALLAMQCLSMKGEDRPTMVEVATELNGLREDEMHP